MVAFFSDFINLIFPSLCLACDVVLLRHEESLCTYCLGELPRSWQTLVSSSLVEEKFWGDIPVHSASALFCFEKEGRLQNMLHKIKYQNRPRAIVALGKFYGLLWKQAPRKPVLDVVIPVPLHLKRLRERGYNQSALLGKGLSASLGIPLLKKSLYRAAYTETQTKKSRAERQENVRGVFRISAAEKLANKHVLLVDDLITTGATLKSCATVLLNANVSAISIATLAVAL